MTTRTGSFVIEFDEWVKSPQHIDAYAMVFRITSPDQTLRIARILYLDLQVGEVLRRAGFTTPKMDELGFPAHREDTQVVAQAMLRLGVRRLERALAEGDAPTDQLWDLQLTDDDVDVLVGFDAEKRCRYQHEQHGDLYCAAASPEDKTVIGSDGLRRLAPTSRPLCAACGMPDEDVLCSHLTHPEVVGIVSGSGIVRRGFVGAQCQLGRLEISVAMKCRAGDHECWQRIVRPRARTLLPVAALTLAEGVDHLNATWRLAFDKKAPLFELRTAAEIVGLSLPCATRDEFEARMSDLADLVDRIRIDDALIPDATGDEQKGSLNRLSACLRSQLPEEERAGTVAAITALRNALEVRRALQHADAQHRLGPALERLGLAFPIEDYGSTWDAIRSLVAEALTTIRAAVRRKSESED